MTKIPFLSCVHCLKEFQHKETFVAYINEEGAIIIATHNNCGLAQDKPEREGTGWVVLQRDYNKYQILTD